MHDGRAADSRGPHAVGVDAMGSSGKIFRQHDVAPVVTSSMLYRQLTLDWAHLHARSTTSAAVRRWSRTEPDLSGFDRPGDVVDSIDRADHPRKDALLLALIRLLQADDALAGQTLLHAMLPGLAVLAARSASRLPDGEPDRAEAARQLVVEEFWEIAARYPVLRRRHRVASNLVLDTLKQVTRHVGQAVPVPVDPSPLDADLVPAGGYGIHRRLRHGAFTTDEPVPDGDLGPESDLPSVLAWAVRSDVITLDEAQMLADVYLPATTHGWGFDDVAQAHDTSRAAIKMRCSRAVARLTAAARTTLNQTA